MEAIQAFYNIWGKDYDEDMISVKYANPGDVSAEAAARFKDKNIRVVDVGAGTGEGGVKLKEAGFTNIDAFDGSEGMLEKAKTLGVYQNFIQELIPREQVPLQKIEANTYDLAASSGAFYPCHLQGMNLLGFVGIVKKGGLLILSSCPHNDEGV